jgi:hypothetical protein
MRFSSAIIGANPHTAVIFDRRLNRARELLFPATMRTERSVARTTKPDKSTSSKPAAKPRASRSKKPPTARPEAGPIVAAPEVIVTTDAIAVRAYEIFLARNGSDGDPVSDWLQAERELRAES